MHPHRSSAPFMVPVEQHPLHNIGSCVPCCERIGPVYILDVVTPYTPPRSLRSATANRLVLRSLVYMCCIVFCSCFVLLLCPPPVVILILQTCTPGSSHQIITPVPDHPSTIPL